MVTLRQNPAGSAQPAAQVPGSGGGGAHKVWAGEYVHDEAYDGGKHDLGPWSETPKSSRVARYRYDYYNRALQVVYKNGRGHNPQGYIYLGFGYEDYRSFARVASKGKHVNAVLNNFEYRPMDAVLEADAPSNSRHTGITSRSRG